MIIFTWQFTSMLKLFKFVRVWDFSQFNVSYQLYYFWSQLVPTQSWECSGEGGGLKCTTKLNYFMKVSLLVPWKSDLQVKLTSIQAQKSSVIICFHQRNLLRQSKEQSDHDTSLWNCCFMKQVEWLLTCVCSVLCKFVSGLILWFLENLWFGDLCAKLTGDWLKFVLALM